MPAAFAVRLDATMLYALGRLAEQTDRSRSWLVAQAVETCIDLNAWQLEKTEAGMKVADRGELATDPEIARLRSKLSAKR